jgi:non-ribosomal peptide synthetase component F
VKPATTFVDLLQQVKEKDLAAFGNADVPFERLVEQVGRERSQAYSPLFQVMLTFQNMALGTFALPGLELSAVDDGFDSAMFDLQLTGIEEFDEHGALSDIRMRFTYATDLYDAATMELFAARLRAVVDAVAADPTVVLRTIDIVTDFERALIEAAEPKTAADLPDLAAAAAAADPTAVAFTHGDTVVTFTQLAEKLAVMKQTMGAALTADALVSVSLNGLVPGILPALGADGITSLVESLITDAQATLGKGSGTDG